MTKRSNWILAACAGWMLLASPPAARADGWALVGHVGVAWLNTDFDDVSVEDSDWVTGTADVSLERRLFSPFWIGGGAEFLFENDEFDAISNVSPFLYGKFRLPLPFQFTLGGGIQWRQASFDLADEETNLGYLFLAGIGFKLANLGLELEVRTVRNDFDFTEFGGWTLSPGIALHF